jgi:hypothetical protein
MAAMAGLVAGSLLTAGYLGARQDRSLFDLDGRDWATMEAQQKVAWTQGFLAGRALGQLPDSAARDTLVFAKELAQLRRGGLAFPYAPSLYVSRMGDYYYWENHRPHPLWRAMLDVNAELKR